MPDRKKTINGLHDLRRYLEDKEWSDNRSDRRAGAYVETVIDAIDLLKEQESVELCDRCGRKRLESGRSVKWE